MLDLFMNIFGRPSIEVPQVLNRYIADMKYLSQCRTSQGYSQLSARISRLNTQHDVPDSQIGRTLEVDLKLQGIYYLVAQI